MSDDRPRSGSGGSSVQQVLFQGEERNTSDKMEFLLIHLPKLVSEYPWKLQNEFAKMLDPIKMSGNDWRAVASRLQFSSIIPQLKQTQSPTVGLLGECTETTSKELLEILVDEKRTDVLECISKFISKNMEQFGPKCPTQESVLDGSFCSDLSWPLQDSGNASDVSHRRLGPQESEEKDENFFSDESQKFWLNIPGNYEQKSWKNFSQVAKNWCPNEMQQGNVEKFLCHVLHIEYGL